MKDFTKLEHAVLDWIKDNRSVPNLKEQICASEFKERDNTGVSSFTTLSVNSDLPRIKCKSPIIGPCIESDGIEHGGSANLFIDDSGHIDVLEIYASGNRFDESTTTFELYDWEWEKEE